MTPAFDPEPVVHRDLGPRNVNDLAISPDGRWLVTLVPGSDDDGSFKTLRFDALDGDRPPVGPFASDRRIDPFSRLALSPDGRWLVTVEASEDESLLWRLGPEPRVEPRVLEGVRGATFSPDGRWLASYSTSHDAFRLLRLEDAGPAPPSVDLSGPAPYGFAVAAFSPDGRWLVAAFDDRARLWDLQRLPDSHLLAAEDESEVYVATRSVAFSPDGRWVATSGDAARLWRLDAPDGPPVILRSGANVGSLAFSPDGRWLATREDASAHLWDLEAPGAVPSPIALRGPSGRGDIPPLFDAASRFVAVEDFDRLRVWPVGSDALLDLARRVAGRNLDRVEFETHFPGEPYRRTFDDLPLERAWRIPPELLGADE